jgi:hypothetical protein
MLANRFGQPLGGKMKKYRQYYPITDICRVLTIVEINGSLLLRWFRFDAPKP